jgi:hypothetical protein
MHPHPYFSLQFTCKQWDYFFISLYNKLLCFHELLPLIQCLDHALYTTHSFMFHLCILCLGKLTRLWSRVLLGKLIVAQLAKILPASYGIPNFITVLIRDRHPFAHYHSVSIRSILILSSQRHGSPNKILYSFDIMPIRATYPAHHILLDLDSLIMFGEGRNCCVFRLLFSPASCHILTPRSKYYRDAEIVVSIRY